MSGVAISKNNRISPMDKFVLRCITACLPAVSLLPLCPASAGEWSLKLETENVYAPHEPWESALEATIEYSTENWETHLEYEVPYQPELEDGSLEWEYAYSWQFDNSKFTLQNELVRDFESNRTRSQLTPRYYYRESKTIRLGFDLEMDYYDSRADSSFDLFGAELEPTIIYSALMGKGRFYAELEFPKLQLYTKDDEEDDFRFTGFEWIIRYRQNMTEKTRLLLELKLPYDRDSNELEVRPNIGIRHYF